MTLLALALGLSAAMGTAVGVVSRRVPAVDPASPRATRAPARAIERTIGSRERLRRVLLDRLDPRVTTGLLLSIVLFTVLLLGVLAFQIRAELGITSLDRTIERWTDRHSTTTSTDVLRQITDLGGNALVVAIGLGVAVFEWARSRKAWAIGFLAVVVIGQSIATNLIKLGIGRQRPPLGLAADLDPSFPSGHSASAAATLAACALLLGRRRSPSVQAVLMGIAVALGVAVGCTRVMLGVHWFSDVVGGLAVGWAWFAITAIAFGGRLLHFGTPVEAAERHESLVTARGGPAPG